MARVFLPIPPVGKGVMESNIALSLARHPSPKLVFGEAHGLFSVDAVATGFTVTCEVAEAQPAKAIANVILEGEACARIEMQAHRKQEASLEPILTGTVVASFAVGLTR